MKECLQEFRDLENKIKDKSKGIKNNPDILNNDINEVKALKNIMFEKASKTFIYNLKKLIQIENTQKRFASRVGISEDLLSKYKSGGAFPSIETLMYICDTYGLSIDKLINTTLTAADIERLELKKNAQLTLFEDRYFVYFLVTNIDKTGAIHEGVIDIRSNDVKFSIFSGNEVVKYFIGNYVLSDRLIFFSMSSPNNVSAYINMIRPNLCRNKYVGGLAMLMLPSDANSKPCAQKILFSSAKLNRELHYDKLKELLNFHVEERELGNIKISQWEDELAYNFISKQN